MDGAPENIHLPDGTHDWYRPDDNPDAWDIWACVKNSEYARDEVAKFTQRNPGKRLVLMESTINLRFRIVDHDQPALVVDTEYTFIDRETR